MPGEAAVYTIQRWLWFALVSREEIQRGSSQRELLRSGMSTFRVSALPDVGGFAVGHNAPLAYDILKRTAAHDVPRVVDLADCVHLKPYAIACLCGLGLLGQARGQEVELILPEDPSCLDHLCRLDLPRWFRCGPIPDVVQRQTNLPVEHVTWPPGHAAERIIDMLAPQAGLPPGISPRMKESLDEVVQNALTHARSPIDCVAVGQAFPNAGKVDVAVLDLGQTILHHLRSNPEHADLVSDEEAIKRATVDGVTGTAPGQRNSRGGLNSGAGLAFVRDYCQRGGGELTILSGNRWVTYAAGETEPTVGQLYGPRFQGCLVNIRYYTQSTLQASGVEPIL